MNLFPYLPQSAPLRRCHWLGCSSVFSSSLDLKNHLEKVHLGANKGSYKCEWEGCNFGERRKIYDLKTHITLHHQHLSYFCKICGKGFLRDQELRKHITVGCPKSAEQRAIEGALGLGNHSLSPISQSVSPASSPMSGSENAEGSGQSLDLNWPENSGESKKRQRTEYIERFFEDVKKEKIDPSPTTETLSFLVKANDMLDQDPEFLSNFDLSKTFDFLQSLKESVEGTPDLKLNTIFEEITHDRDIEANSPPNLAPQEVDSVFSILALSQSLLPSPTPRPGPILPMVPMAAHPPSGIRTRSAAPSSQLKSKKAEQEVLSNDFQSLDLNPKARSKSKETKSLPQLSKESILAIIDKLLRVHPQLSN